MSSSSEHGSAAAAPPSAIDADPRAWSTPQWLPRSLLLPLSALIFIALTSLTAISLWQKRTETLNDAAKTTQNLTLSLEAEALRSVREIDLELSILARTLPDIERSPGEVRVALRQDLRPEAQFSNLIVINADGRLVADALDQAPAAFAQRDLFIAHRDNAGSEIYISTLSPSSDGKDWSLAVSRRLTAGDGRFAGVVAAFVNLDRLRRFYASLDIGDRGAVALWDGAMKHLLVRHPPRPERLDKPMDGGLLYDELRAGRNEGVFHGLSTVDGVDRIIGFRRVANLPLVVVVRLDAQEVMASWRRDAWHYGAGVGFVCTLLLALTGILHKQFARQEALVAALRLSEATASQLNRRFEDAIGSLSVSFSLFDADDRLVIANRANSAMADARAGVSFSTLLEHAAAGLMHPDTLGDDPQAWISWRLARHRNPSGPIEQRYRDGRWVRIDETRTREGGTVVVRTDITELKKIEETLRFSEERFRDYTETASDWNWETDAEHRFSYLSTQEVETDQGLDHLVTMPRAKLIGMRRADLALDADDPKWRTHHAALDRHEPFTGFVYKTLSIAGKERHVSTSGKPVFDGNGTFVGYRGTGRDVTEQVEGEASLREAKAEAEAASRAKSEFLAAMSHELRTPLNAIIGFSEIIAHQRFASDPARIRAYAADIHSSGHHLLKVINDILEVSRIEAGKLELHEEAVDLVTAVETCLMLVGQRAKEGDVALNVTMPRDLPHLLADETRIKQIFLNLLSNAVKFTPRGGSVSVTAGLSDDGRLAVSVCDDGIGMTPDEIVVAMQPFRQVDSSLSRRFEGSGLGLPLTKAFTELHGGHLDITSAPGEGTTVHVTFPPSRVVVAALSAPRANAS